MKKKLILFSSVLITIILVSSSSKPHVFYDYNKKHDFSVYKTYAWIAPFDTTVDLHIKKRPYEHFIMANVDNQLKTKGLTPDTINPDIVIMYDAHIVSIDKVEEASQTYVGVGVYSPYYYGPGYYGGPTFDPNGYYGGYGYPAYGYGYGGGYYYQAPVGKQKDDIKYTVEEGVILFNIFDAKTKAVVWSGGADEELGLTTNIPAELTKVITQVFSKYPKRK
jgi:hypothetical protein